MAAVIVVDASVVVDLLARFRAEPIEATLYASDTWLAAPELLDIEVLQALRRLAAAGAIPATRRHLPETLAALRIRRYRHASLIAGIWALRGNLTAYDAAYVTLARALDATLVTRDEHLAAAPDLGIPILVP